MMKIHALFQKSVSGFLAVLLLFALAPALRVSAEDVQISKQFLVIESEAVEDLFFSCEEYNVDGYNYFKLRDIAYILSDCEERFSIGWDADSQTVSLKSGEPYTPVGGELYYGPDSSGSVAPSQQTLMINGTLRDDLSVYNIGGNNFFKLRDLGEALGFKVGYDAEYNIVMITPTIRASSVDSLRSKADMTDEFEQYERGMQCFNGKGQDYKPEEAFYWLASAANQGYPPAQCEVGYFYDKGIGGVTQDYTQALYWYSLAADQGDSVAQNNIGVLYRYGRGVEKDPWQALYWFTLAADQGYSLAMLNLGRLYESEFLDYTQALSWYEKAISAGNKDAEAAYQELLKKVNQGGGTPSGGTGASGGKQLTVDDIYALNFDHASQNAISWMLAYNLTHLMGRSIRSVDSNLLFPNIQISGNTAVATTRIDYWYDGEYEDPSGTVYSELTYDLTTGELISSRIRQ